MSNLSQLAIGIGAFTIVIVIAFLVMAQTKTQDTSVSGTVCNSTSGSLGCNATKDLQEATDTIPGWVPLIVIVTIGGAILMMVSRFGR